MKYEQIKEGRFIARPNRFVANVIAEGCEVKAHVKNTGRLKELLVNGAAVYLQKCDNTNRSTKWSLIGVRKGHQIVNIDSQVPNKVMHEWLSTGGLETIELCALTENRTGGSTAKTIISTANTIISPGEEIITIKPEYTYGNSRLDFFIETNMKKILMEVKGVTLEENGAALFPDAPTERGVKHIKELCRSLKEGYFPVIAFVIQMNDVRYFSPNAKTHKEFAEALIYAHSQGVIIIALNCEVSCDSIVIKNQVDVITHRSKKNFRL